MLLSEQADRIEHVLVAAGLGQRAGKLGFDPLFVGQRAEEMRVDQRIDEMRILGKNVGEPRRDAEDQRDESHQLRILPEQRKEATAGA